MNFFLEVIFCIENIQIKKNDMFCEDISCQKYTILFTQPIISVSVSADTKKSVSVSVLAEKKISNIGDYHEAAMAQCRLKK